MDPKACLDAAVQALETEDFDKVRECLANYKRWRSHGGFMPYAVFWAPRYSYSGDAVAKMLQGALDLETSGKVCPKLLLLWAIQCVRQHDFGGLNEAVAKYREFREQGGEEPQDMVWVDGAKYRGDEIADMLED